MSAPLSTRSNPKWRGFTTTDRATIEIETSAPPSSLIFCCQWSIQININSLYKGLHMPD